jgi:hypothetical protein
MSAPIGLPSMIACPGWHIHAYDLGQVLDLAEPRERRTYKWPKDLDQYRELDAAGAGVFPYGINSRDDAQGEKSASSHVTRVQSRPRAVN